MPYQEDFEVEQFMDKYETYIEHNLGETCCYSLSLDEIAQISGSEPFKLPSDVRFTYGAIKGTDQLRNQIAKLYGPEFTKENVLITNGAIAANFLVYYSLVGAGDHVICVHPTYNQLHSVPKMFGAEVDFLMLKKEDAFVPNISTLKDMIKPNTKLIIINNPNNPLGSVIGGDLLREICQICEKNKIYLHSDEVYRPIFHSLPEGDTPPPSACEAYDKAVVTGSMSKAFSLAGIRIGWIITKDSQVLRTASSRRDYNTISVSMMDDFIAQYGLENKDAIIKRNYKLCLDNLQILNKFIEENSDLFEYVNKPQGATVCLLRLKSFKETEKFAAFLAENYKVLSVPGEALGVPGTLRIGYANSAEDLTNGLPLLKQAVLDWTNKE